MLAMSITHTKYIEEVHCARRSSSCLDVSTEISVLIQLISAAVFIASTRHTVVEPL